MFHQNWINPNTNICPQQSDIHLFQSSFPEPPQDEQQQHFLETKRDQYLEEIRSQKRKQYLHKKRLEAFSVQSLSKKLNTLQIQDQDQLLADDNLLIHEFIENYRKENFSWEDFDSLVEDLNSNHKLNQHHGIIGLRKILSGSNDDSSSQRSLPTNIVARIIEFMQMETEPYLQLEATWVFSSFCGNGTAEQIQEVIDKGAIPILVKLLNAPRKNLVEHVVSAIGKITGNCAKYRDLLLAHKVMAPLVAVLQQRFSEENNFESIKSGVQTLINFCKGKPGPDYESVKDAMPLLSIYVQTSNDLSMISDALFALTDISYGDDNSKILPIIKTGITPFLVKHLSSPNLNIVIGALRALGQIVLGLNGKADVVLQVPNTLEELFRLAQHDKRTIKREACWTISTIASGRSNQIERIIGNPEYVELLIKNALNDKLTGVQREAAGALVNTMDHASEIQMISMANMGVLDCFCKLGEQEDAGLVKIGLNGIERFLSFGSMIASKEVSENKYLAHAERNSLIDILERLQSFEDEEIKELILNIIKYTL